VPETTAELEVAFWAETERAAKTPETMMVEKRMLTVLSNVKLIDCTVQLKFIWLIKTEVRSSDEATVIAI
jgi:hypothetical protein